MLDDYEDDYADDDQAAEAEGASDAADFDSFASMVRQFAPAAQRPAGQRPAGQRPAGQRAPNSFRDPAWDVAEAKAASKYAVPVEYLRGIRVDGERSNGDQVSPKGAKGVYQFMPKTRDAFLKKYNVDAYSSNPEEQAAAAALHLKESYGRTKDWLKAVAGYNGGVSGENGTNGTKENRDYVARVAAGTGGQTSALGRARRSRIQAPDMSDVSGASAGGDTPTQGGTSFADMVAAFAPASAPEPAPAPPPAPLAKETLGGHMQNTLVQLGEGVNTTIGSAVGGLDWAASMMGVKTPDWGVREFFKGNAETTAGWQTDRMQELIKRTDAENEKVRQEQGELAALAHRIKQLKDNPSLAARLAATNAATLVPGLGAIKGAQLAGLGARGALAAGAATNAQLTAGDAFGDAYDRIYKEARQRGATEQDAKELATEGAKLPGAVGFIAGGIGGSTGVEAVAAKVGTRGALKIGGELGKGTMANVLAAATDASKKTAIKGAIKKTFSEAAGELPEELLPAIAGNVAVGELDGKTQWSDGLGRTAVDAVAGATPAGAAGGAVHARYQVRSARDLSVALNSPDVDPKIKAQARDLILEEAAKAKVAPEQMDAWLESQFMEDDQLAADNAAALESAAQADKLAAEETQGLYDRAKESQAIQARNQTLRDRLDSLFGMGEPTAPDKERATAIERLLGERTGGMIQDENGLEHPETTADRLNAEAGLADGRRAQALGGLAPSNPLLDAARERAAAQDADTQAQAQAREVDRQRMLGNLTDRTDPLTEALAARRAESEQANAELLASANRPAPTDPLVRTGNSEMMASLGRRAVGESTPPPKRAPAPAPAPAPKLTEAQQVANREAERNQRGRKEFGINKKAALATFAEADQALVDGLIDETEFNEMAGLLAGDAVRIADVRTKLAEVKNEARIVRANKDAAKPMEGGKAPDVDAITADLEGEAAKPATDLAMPKSQTAESFLAALDANRKDKGDKPLTKRQRMVVTAALGYGPDGQPIVQDGTRRAATTVEAAQEVSRIVGKTVSPNAVSQMLNSLGIDQRALKAAFAGEMPSGAIAENADADAQANESADAGDVAGSEQTRARGEEDFNNDRANDDTTEATDDPTTEMDEGAMDAKRKAERAASANREALPDGTSDELASALDHNGSLLDMVPTAREMWNETNADLVDFDSLPVARQSEYVRAVLRNDRTDREGRPLLSTQALMRLEDEILSSIPLEEADAPQPMQGVPQADAQLGDELAKKWAGHVRTVASISDADVASVVQVAPTLGQTGGESFANGKGDVTLVELPTSHPATKMLVAPIKSLLASRAGLVARMVLPKLKGISFFMTDGNSNLEGANAIFIPQRESVHVQLSGDTTAAQTNANPRDRAAAAAMAGTMGHEIVQHAADHFAGKAIGQNGYASLTPGGPLAISVNQDSNGRVSLKLGPVIKELYDVYSGESAGDAADRAGRPESTDEGAPGRGAGAVSPTQQLQGAQGAADRVDAGQPARGQATSEPAGDAGRGNERPADSSGLIAGIDFVQAFISLDYELDQLDESGKPTHQQLADLIDATETATKEAWAILGEAMLSDPVALKAQAPLAHALISRAWQARSLEHLGEILAGREARPGKPKPKTDPGRPSVDAQMRPPKSPKEATERANGAFAVGAKDLKNAIFLKAGMLLDIAEAGKKHLPSIKPYVELLRRGQADRAKSENQVQAVIDDYFKLEAAERGTGPGTLNAFLMESTGSKKWGFKPDWLPGAPVDPLMAAKFKALSPAAQGVVKSVFKHGHDSIAELRKQALAAIVHESDTAIEAARRNGDTAAVTKAENAKLRSVDAFASLAALDTSWPYAPLKRFGDYVTIARSQALLDAEAKVENRDLSDDERAAARKQVKEMRQNPDHYGVWFSEGRYDGRKRTSAVQGTGKFAKVEGMARESNEYGNQGDMLGAFRRLNDLVENSADSDLREKSAQALRQLMADLHLSLISDQSVRQSGRHRENVLGADPDMMRAFDTQARAMAAFTASIHNTREINKTISDMRAEVRDDTNAGNVEERQDLFNEVLRRHMMGLDYRTSAWSRAVSRIMAGTSAWLLLTSLGYHINNATQPWVLSLPFMAGEHGFGRSTAALTKAYADIAPALKDFRISSGDVGTLPADVRAEVQELMDSGAIMINLDSIMGRWGGTSDGAVTGSVRGALRVMNKAAQSVEAVNRLATAVAAVRLAKERGQDAVAFARDVISRTHGEYADWNAPRFMRTPTTRLMTQFRKFQVIQASLFIRMGHDAMSGESKEVRYAATKSLLFSLAAMGAVGGLVGMPGFTTIAFLVGALSGLVGDDDEPPVDLEQSWRESVGDSFGGQILTRGMPYALGYDVSGRIGAGQMLSILPFTDLSVSRDGVEKTVFGLAGAGASVAANAADGIKMASEGQMWKGLERMVPKGAADLSKAWRLSTKGETNARGDVVLSADEIDTMDAIMQGIGLPGTVTSERSRSAGLKYKIEQFYKARAQSLQREYTEAVRAGDSAAAAEVRAAWANTQKAREEMGLKRQPVSSLMRAAAAQKRRERDTLNGLQFKRDNKKLVEKLTGAEDDGEGEDD